MTRSVEHLYSAVLRVLPGPELIMSQVSARGHGPVLMVWGARRHRRDVASTDVERRHRRDPKTNAERAAKTSYPRLWNVSMPHPGLAEHGLLPPEAWRHGVSFVFLRKLGARGTSARASLVYGVLAF